MVIWKELEFDFDGGMLCLDFVNTADAWVDGRPVEHELHALQSYEAVVAFARAAGIVDEVMAEHLAAKATDSRDAADEALRQALDLREAIFRVVVARIEGAAPEPEHLERLNAIYMEGLRHRRLAWRGDSYEVAWSGVGEDFSSILWPIAESAVQLLVGEDISLARHCNGDGCDWLFIDTTRNHSRRWCSMSGCGNRAKAKRHYQKRRSASA